MDTKPRKKASMMSRTSSRFTDDSDDLRSVVSSMSFKSAAVVDQAATEEVIIFKVVELSADALVDRFLEFQDTTILIRTYEGQDSPGAIVGVVSSTSNAPMPVQTAQRTSANKSLSELRNASAAQPVHSGDSATELKIIHYTDKDFYHVFDFKQPLLLCSPSNPGTRFSEDLRCALEKTLKVSCIPMPVMNVNVACSFSTLNAISAFVAAKESIAGGNRNENDFSAISALPSSVANSLSATFTHRGAAAKNAFRNSSGSSGDNTASTNLVNEFCLLFFQGASPPELLRALDRIRMSVQSTQIPRRVGPVLDSFLATVNPLLEVFWKAKYSSIVRDEVSTILQQIICKILDANVAFMFLRHAVQCQQLLFGLLSDSTRGSFSLSGHQCIVSLFSLLGSVDCVKELRASGHSSGKLSDLLMIALRIAESCSSAFQCFSTSPAASESLVSSKSLATALALGTSVKPREAESSAYRNDSKSMDELSTLWTSLPVCLDVIMTALDDVVASLSSAPYGSEHELMKAATIELNHCVMKALRSLYGAPLELVKASVGRAAPSISSYFRRVASWGEYLYVAPLWPEVLSEGIAFAVCVTLAREHSANSLPFVQHEWLARISIATGPLAARSLLSEAHEMFVTFSQYFPDWIDRQSASHALMKAVFSQLLIISERIARSAPSPSLLLSCWENCRVILSHYLDVVNDTLGLQSRVALARTLIENGLGSVLDSAAHRGDAGSDPLPMFHEELQDNSDWDDLMSYREWSLRGIAGRFPPTSLLSVFVIPPPFAAGLYYILPAVEHEKLSKRWNALAANLFMIAQVLVDLSAPLALSTQFVEAAVQISQKFRGFDRASSASICQRYVVEAFDRISSASAWKLSSAFLAKDDNMSQLQVEHKGEKSPNVAFGHFAIAAAPDDDGPKFSVMPPNHTQKAAKRANVLFKIATTYKDS